MSKIVQESNALYGVLNILHVHTLKYSWTAKESSLGSKGQKALRLHFKTYRDTYCT